MKQDEETRNMQEEEEKESTEVLAPQTDDDDEDIPWVQEDDIPRLEAYHGFMAYDEDIDIEEGRRLYLEYYMSQIHGVDVALHEDMPMERDMLRDLVEDIGEALGDENAVINPFFNQRDRMPHLLIVSKRPLFEVIRALPADAAYSAVPAFLTDEEHVPTSVYQYMSLNRCYATTLTTY